MHKLMMVAFLATMNTGAYAQQLPYEFNQGGFALASTTLAGTGPMTNEKCPLGGRDKCEHFVVGGIAAAGVSAVVYHETGEPLAAFAAGLLTGSGIGAIKEVADVGARSMGMNAHPGMPDFWATAGGAALGAALTTLGMVMSDQQREAGMPKLPPVRDLYTAPTATGEIYSSKGATVEAFGNPRAMRDNVLGSY